MPEPSEGAKYRGKRLESVGGEGGVIIGTFFFLIKHSVKLE